MIIVTFDKATGRLSSVLTAPEIDPAEYETDTEGAVEYLGSGLDMNAEYWVRPDYPVVGGTSFQKVGPPLVANYAWDWPTHTYVGDVPKARTAAKARVTAGRDEALTANFAWGPYVFLGDEGEQSRIRSFALEAFMSPGTFTVDWRLSNDATVTLNGSDMVAVFGAMQARNRLVQDHANSLLDSADTASALSPTLTAITALNLITWTDP